jgi:hypothetical protein
MRVAGINQGLTGHSKDILRKATGDHLDQVHSDQKVLEMIRRGRLVLVIRGQESQNLVKEDYQARVHSYQMVLVIARQETGPCERRLNSRATFNFRATLYQAKAKGNYLARVHSDQTILVAVRQEAGLVAWWPKALKEKVRKQLGSQGM